MKIYGWIFGLGGAMWAIGYGGLALGLHLYPDSNLLGGYALLFAPIMWIGNLVFMVTIPVCLIHMFIRWTRKPKAENMNT